MSFELYTTNDKYLGELATNKGLDDLQVFVTKAGFKALQALCDNGQSEDITGLVSETEKAVTDKDTPPGVVETLKGMRDMLKKADDIVLIVS